jgi:DHA1 family bicyclomycin/chloramphenicol resistance-like MFS transporter
MENSVASPDQAEESQYRLKMKEPPLTSLILLSAFASMGAILITPGIPSIAAFFDISIGTAQLTMTAFLLGYAIGQLIYGPIANRLGRKPAFYIGIFVATLGSLFSILASPIESFPLLIFGRTLEALGSSVGLVVCFTIINDFYYPTQVRKVVGLMMISFALVPGVGIAAGGFLVQHFGWQSCFYFLLFYGIFLVLPAVTLPETLLSKDTNALHHKYVFKNYWKMICIKKLVGYSVIGGLSGGCLYIFCAEGPYIGIHLLGFSPSTYGLVGLFPYIGTLLGAGIMVKTSKILPQKVINTGIFLEVIGTLAMLVCFLLNHISLWSLLIPIGLLFVGHAILYGNAASLAISQTEDKANASAMVNFLAIGTGVISTLLFGLLHSSKPSVMPSMFVVSLALMGVIYLLLIKEKNLQ